LKYIQISKKSQSKNDKSSKPTRQEIHHNHSVETELLPDFTTQI